MLETLAARISTTIPEQFVWLAGLCLAEELPDYFFEFENEIPISVTRQEGTIRLFTSLAVLLHQERQSFKEIKS